MGMGAGLISPGPIHLRLPTSIPSRYTVRDLGTLGGAEIEVRAINNRGQIVGESKTRQGQTHAFLWYRGHIRDLGLLGGTSSHAYGINNHGDVVGAVYLKEAKRADSVDARSSAFLWKNGMCVRLMVSSPDRPRSAAYGINDHGQVAGESDFQDNRPRAFRWGKGQQTDLTTYVESGALSINNKGQMVGDALIGEGGHLPHALFWTGRSRQDLGTLGHTISEAVSINDKGQVVGWVNGPDNSRAIVWYAGEMSYLGGSADWDSTRANGINSHGVVVGDADSSKRASHAMIWIDRKLIDLNTLISRKSGWVLTRARAINDRGQIVGTGIHNGKQRAYVLTPISHRDF